MVMDQLTPENAPPPTIFDLWRGVTEHRDSLPPIITGTVRGPVESMALGALLAAGAYWEALDLPTWANIAGPSVVQGLNMARGFADQIDPRKIRAIRAR